MKSLLFLLLASASFAGAAESEVRYHVTVTNLTTTQTLSPPLLAIHSPEVSVFTPGQSASRGVAVVAEDGERGPLKAELMATGKIDSLYEALNPVMPGKSVRYLLTAKSKYSVLSFVTMLVTTNDGFSGVSGLPLPLDSFRTKLPAYDAGSEENTESCAHIPGPPCGAHNVRVPQAEGRIMVHPGIRGGADLSPVQFGWSHPAVKVTVRKL